MVLDSFDEKAKLGRLSLVGFAGAESSEVCGETVSTVNVTETGSGSGLPAASRPRTWNV